MKTRLTSLSLIVVGLMPVASSQGQQPPADVQAMIQPAQVAAPTPVPSPPAQAPNPRESQIRLQNILKDAREYDEVIERNRQASLQRLWTLVKQFMEDYRSREPSHSVTNTLRIATLTTSTRTNTASDRSVVLPAEPISETIVPDVDTESPGVAGEREHVNLPTIAEIDSRLRKVRADLLRAEQELARLRANTEE